MSRRDEHFDAMLRHLGATYYQTRRGEGSAQDVERALESVEDAHRSGGAAGEALAHAGPRARSHRGGRWRVRDVMSTDVVTVGKTTSYKEVARLMNDRHIRRLPVLDASGTLIGIVSRRDLLRVFLRPDTEIGAEVHGVLTSVLLEDPQSVTVQVRDGLVTLRGSLREPELIPAAVRLASDVDGVVAVADELTSGPAEPALDQAAGQHA